MAIAQVRLAGDHGLHIGVGDQFTMVMVDFGHPIELGNFVGQFGAWLGNGHHLTVVSIYIVAQVRHLAHIANAGKGDLNWIHHSAPQRVNGRRE